MKICGIGNATVDIQFQADDSYLEDQGFTPGIATYIDLEQALAIESSLSPTSVMAGGAAANSLCGLAKLGAECHFIGKRADDEMGAQVVDDFKGLVTFKTQYTKNTYGTGRCLTFTTEDGERSFSPYFGANHDLSIADMDADLLGSCDMVLLEGYPLQGDIGPETMKKTARLLHELGVKTVFNPSDAGLIQKHRDTVEFILEHTDILICNMDEVKALTGMQNPNQAAAHLSGRFETGALTMSGDGCLAFDKGMLIHVPAIAKPEDIVDTNGAGDQFVAGFLYGYGTGQSLEESAILGHQMAANVLGSFGPRPQ